jgi:hypothetical protein
MSYLASCTVPPRRQHPGWSFQSSSLFQSVCNLVEALLQLEPRPLTGKE